MTCRTRACGLSGPRAVVGAVLAVAAGVFVGCSGTSPQVQVAEMYVSVAAESGYRVEPSCVSKVMSEMSDADAEALVDAGLDGNADLTDAGIDVLTAVANQCLDVGQYLDRLIADYANDPTVDSVCLRSALEDLTSVDAIDRATDSAVQACRQQ